MDETMDRKPCAVCQREYASFLQACPFCAKAAVADDPAEVGPETANRKPHPWQYTYTRRTKTAGWQRFVARFEAMGKRISSPDEYSQVNVGMALGGAALLLVGAFAPLVSAPIAGSFNLFNQNGWMGPLVVAAVVGAVFFALRKRFRFHAYCGLVLMVWLVYMLFSFIQTKQDLERYLDESLADNPFRGLADVAMAQLQWGWALLFIAAGLLIGAAFYRVPRPDTPEE